MRYALLVAFLLFAEITNAEPGPSPYFLFSKHWNCSAMLEAYGKLDKLHLAAIFHTPGEEYSCFDRLVSGQLKHKIASFQLHLIGTGPCRRNKQCGAYEIAPSLGPSSWERAILTDRKIQRQIQSQAARAKAKVVDKLPASAQCYLSPELESNLSERGFRKLVELVKPYFGERCTIVDNRLSGNPMKLMTERHGSSPKLQKPCIYNNDGTSIDGFAAATLARYKDCDLALYWRLPDNCRQEGAFVDPRQRRTCGGAEHFKTVVDAVKAAAGAPAPPPPQFDPRDLKNCKKLYPANDGDKTGFLFKTSDTKQCGADKCSVTLFPSSFKQKFRKVELWKKGRAIDSFKFHYFSDEHGNRQTWSGSKSPSAYPFNVVLNADGACWKINNPRVRVD